VDIGASGYTTNKVTGPNSGIYSCSFCLEKGHNRQTCPKRKASLGKWKLWAVNWILNIMQNV
jgi:hypothetical protein